jgi:ribose transport system ATP-binding protein
VDTLNDDSSGSKAPSASPPGAQGDTRIALRVRGVSKTFPGVRALSDFNLDVRSGSVHALLGHNGCGKSTLVKALAGVHAPDPGGRAWIDEEELQLGDPEDAVRKGLRFVHQELGIIPELGAVDNVGFVLGYERGRFGSINWQRQAKRTVELLREFGFDIDPWVPLGEASPPERAAVAIVRAVAGWQRGRGVLILDEPTASLAKHEVEQLFGLIHEVRATGTAVILVSHRLDEVMAIADHATVMRDGQLVWDGDLENMTLGGLVRLIANTAGEEMHDDGHISGSTSAPSTLQAPVAAEVRGVTSRYLHGVDIEIHEGEIVGVAGLLGSGREEIPYILAGDLTDGVEGVFSIGGQQSEQLSIEKARAAGVALVPADRAREAIFSQFTTGENVTIAALADLRQGRVIRPPQERSFVQRWLEAVHADPDTAGRHISTLSGGNQQKAVLARWLCVSPKLLVLSEPTAGVDIGARMVLYEQIKRRAREGLAVLMASSDVEDLLASCDRVVVLRDGVMVGEFSQAKMTKSAILDAMEGVGSDQRG